LIFADFLIYDSVGSPAVPEKQKQNGNSELDYSFIPPIMLKHEINYAFDSFQFTTSNFVALKSRDYATILNICR
jgi:hypothetical protein